jgi:pimeloyl-ACP methyl ester carboxylesterase
MPVRRPEEFTHHEAQLDGIKIHYVREGRGPPLLLMHGWPGFWWEWYKCIGALAADFDVIAPDMRGYGDSEKPDLSDLSRFHLNVSPTTMPSCCSTSALTGPTWLDTTIPPWSCTSSSAVTVT